MNNKFYKLFIFTSFIISIFTFSVIAQAQTEQDSNLPDNVSITTSPDGTSTTLIINSKPGYSTNIETRCVSGNCTHKTNSRKITDADIEIINENFKKQRQEMDNFWKLQRQLFEQQQKLFQQLWEFNF